MPRYLDKYREMFGNRKPKRNIYNHVIGYYEDEEYKPIPGYMGFISNYGAVYSAFRKKQKKIFKTGYGYRVHLQDNNNDYKLIPVENLMMITFKPNETPKKYVKFINGDIEDTRINNLEWTDEEPIHIRKNKKRLHRLMMGY